MKKNKLFFIPFLAIALITSCNNGGKKGTTYNITYLNLCGSTTDNPTTYTDNDAFTFNNPTDHGYKFTGWRLNESTGIPVSEIKKGTTGDLKLYATWGEANTYEIIYENVDGVQQENPTSYNITKDVRLTNPKNIKTGYGSFTGWYFDKEFTKPANDGWTAGNRYGKTILYAKWANPIKYTITYYDVEESEHSNPENYTIEDEITLKVATRNGSNFISWHLNAKDGKTITKIDKGTIGDVILYAEFSIINYSITYKNLLLSTTDNPDKFTYYDEDIVLKAPNKESGYVFKGWRLDSEEGEEITTIKSHTYTKNLVIYATWGEKKTYSITYDYWGGTVEGSNPTRYTIDNKITLISPTQDGFVFTGWYLDKNKDKTIPDKWNPGEMAGDLNIYAGWKSKTALNAYSWDDIKNISERQEAAKYFDIGDTKTIKIGDGNLDHDVRIIGFNHDDLADGSGKAGITFEFVNLLTVGSQGKPRLYSVYWHDDKTCNNYGQSHLHRKTNDIYNNELKDEKLKSAIKTVKKNAQNGQSAGSFDVKLFPLATSEVTSGSIPYSAIDNEGKLYNFYKTNTYLTKYFNGSKCAYWLRSVCKEEVYAYIAAYIIDNSGRANVELKDDTKEDRGIAPAFCI